MIININSGNPNKIAEYQQYLTPLGHELTTSDQDLDEPNSDHETIIRYKASQFDDNTLVDDVSLIIEGFDVGVNIRWFLESGELNKEKYRGCKCQFVCYIGVKKAETVFLYKGIVEGVITKPQGQGFGIGPFFLPNDAAQTLGEFMQPEHNPRYLALMNFLADKWSAKHQPLSQWQGEFQ
ncbi:non-canonical purine NTP pyrophosphatase [Psychrobium sp. 1_MG-2023]|uniref:non-canonical purine NTP pyrophosphatase n=1 Tax=Psychrobium sp. 1_MG-2023 TaxID=3062624 RepID=UPI000C326F17|nr:non-canonical purine NTP pyrophosphatase [Psychrobium sp. 1_MG-2023]MDP2562805.1 non-canonical purine NTP pyrophosphatase [Psychrobium sp. 1_MG-2023]PKF54446.1 hypothetical protein CW748_15870 [Alteromonadales bacterium alter-6D02]